MTLLGIALGCLGLLALLVPAYFALLASMYPEKLRTAEVYTIRTHDLWKLRLCRYRKGRTGGEPVLFVHGLNANQHNFTSPEGACSVDFLVDKGFDCWTIDLRGCRSSVPPFERYPEDITMDDYLLYDLPTAVDYIRKTTGYAKVHWIGHSMGGILLYAYVQEYGRGHIASGATLGAPIGFEGCRLKVSAPMQWLTTTFRRTTGNLLRGAVPFCLTFRVGGRFFPTNPRNLPRTMNTGHFYNILEDPLPKVLKGMAHALNTHTFRLKGGQLDVVAGLPAMRLPLLAAYAPRDPFTPVEKGQEFVDSLSHGDKAILVLSKENGCAHDYGHCDLAFGQEGAKEVFEPIAKWLAKHPITEHIAHEHEDDVSSPLDGIERAGILSGASYAHLTEENADLAKPLGIEPLGKSVASPRAPAKKEASIRKRATRKKETVAKKKTAGKTKIATTKKATAKKEAPAKKKTTAKKKATATKKAAPKKKTVAKKKAHASKKKASSGPQGTTPAETPPSVKRALANASKALESLDKAPAADEDL